MRDKTDSKSWVDSRSHSFNEISKEIMKCHEKLKLDTVFLRPLGFLHGGRYGFASEAKFAGKSGFVSNIMLRWGRNGLMVRESIVSVGEPNIRGSSSTQN